MKVVKLEGWQILESIDVVEHDDSPTTIKGWARHFNVAVDTFKKIVASMDYELVTITVLRKVVKNG